MGHVEGADRQRGGERDVDAARTLLHSNMWPPSSDKSLYVIVRPREMSSMENSLRCIADGRARGKPFCGKPQFQARALSVAPLRTPLRSSTTVPRRTRVCDPVRMDGRAYVAPPRLRRGLLCARRQIALTPARRRVSLAVGISGHQIIPSSTHDASRNDESINRAGISGPIGVSDQKLDENPRLHSRATPFESRRPALFRVIARRALVSACASSSVCITTSSSRAVFARRPI